MALAGSVLSITFLMTLLKNKSKSLLESFFGPVPSSFHLVRPFPAPSCTSCAGFGGLLPPSSSVVPSALYFLPLLLSKHTAYFPIQPINLCPTYSQGMKVLQEPISCYLCTYPPKTDGEK